MSESPRPTLLELALGWMNIGLTSVGGAAGPLRHVIVKQRHWLTEAELAELFGIAQALPGATGANIAVMMGDRFAGPLGPFAALAGFIIPSLLVAIALAGFATHLAAVSPRFAAAELAVTAAVAGIFISNGLRLAGQLWRTSPDIRATWRLARTTISALAVVLVAGLHVFIPLAMLVLIAVSFAVETRLLASAGEPSDAGPRRERSRAKETPLQPPSLGSL